MQDTLNNVVSFLKPFCTLTDLLSGEKEVTISSVLPLMTYIKDLCAPTTEEEVDVGGFTESQLNMRNDLKKYIVDYMLSR